MYRLGFCGFICLFIGLVAQATLPDLIPLRVGKQFGYCDHALQIVIQPQYEDAQPFGTHGAIVKKNGRYGIIDVRGQWTMAPELDEIVVSDVLRLRKGTYYAIADLTGCTLTDFVYDQVYALKNGYLLTERDGKKGLLDPTGHALVPNAYDHIAQLRDHQGNYVDLLSVSDLGEFGLYNTCGERVQSLRFNRIDVFHEGFAIVQQAGQFGLIDLEGRLRVPCQYDLLQPMSEGLCAAKLKNRWGFIDREGRQVLPFLFEAVQEVGFFEGRAAVNKAGTWVFVNRLGEVEFPLDNGYQSLGSLSEGLASVCKLVDEGTVHYGYVDPEGHLRIPLKYDRAEQFRRGFAIVGLRLSSGQSIVKEMQYGVIDRNGRTIIPCLLRSQSEARLKRDSLGYLGFATIGDHGRLCKIDSHGKRFDCKGNALDALQKAWMGTRCENAELIAVSREGRWGFCDARGKLVIPCQFAAVQCFVNGLARVWPPNNQGDASYYIDESGRAYLREGI